VSNRKDYPILSDLLDFSSVDEESKNEALAGCFER